MKKTLLSTLLLLSFSGCSESSHKPTATEVYFQEQERGVEPYTTRMIVTKDWLRIDDGEGAKDFILYNRNTRVISSLTFTNQRIFEISSQVVNNKAPTSLSWQRKSIQNTDMPSIDNTPTQQYDFLADDKPCLHIISAKGLLTDVRLALIEYQTVLAGEQQKNLKNTPVEMQNSCDLGRFVYYATDKLQEGFPVVEWDEKGYKRMMGDFKKDVEIDNKLFELPESFKRFSLP